jgi:hypothetical protein
MHRPRPPTPPQPTLTYRGSQRIWLAPLLCPHCADRLGAEDVELFSDQVRLICPACHRDMLAIERLQNHPSQP